MKLPLYIVLLLLGDELVGFAKRSGGKGCGQGCGSSGGLVTILLTTSSS